MTIQELHYDFKIKLNRVDSSSNFDFNEAQIDWLLNEAQLLYIKQRFTPTNSSKIGFEASQKRTDDLSTVVVKWPLQPSLTLTSLGNSQYELNLDSLQYPYLFFLGGYASLTISSNCTKEIPLRFTQNDDFREALRDPFNSPSQEFIPYNFGLAQDGTSRSIYLYGPSEPLTTIKPEYIRTPPRVSTGNYIYIDGILYSSQSFILSSHTHPEIVDLSVQLAAISTDNPQLVQLKSQKLVLHE